MYFIINIAIYQAVWVLCVFLADRGVLPSLVLLGGHLLSSPHRRADIQIMAVLLAAGILIDGAFHRFGIMSFAHPGWPIPLWLGVIWLALAILPHHSLRWLKKKPLLSALFGAIGGPLAYWAGVQAGAASFGVPMMLALFLLACVWAVFWPAAMMAAERMLPKTTARKKKVYS